MSAEYETEFSRGKKVLVVINPKAGRGITEARVRYLKHMLKKYGFVYDLYFTRYAKHTTKLTLEYGEKYDIVLCCGGDGTLNETVEAVMQLQKKPIIGYIPNGTTNDFAKTTRLPRAVGAAVRMMANGKTQCMDCGVINETVDFVYVASFGAFTRVSYTTPQRIKNFFGKSAYLFDGLKSLKEIRPYHARIVTEDTVYEDDFIFVSVTNSLSVGGVMNLPSDLVNLSDGRFELLMIKNPLDAIEIPEMIHGCVDLNYENDNIILTQASSVKIEIEDGAPFTADGEYAGTYKTANIANINPGYEILVP
ncbi:MAG: diacylglycerol kinase family lipid kinase [Clostridia bacterium]|nr:diacylglycerol kinase family lipid kinase [Clostridia bacterium]